MPQHKRDIFRDPIWTFIFGASAIVLAILALLVGVFALSDPWRELCAAICIVVIVITLIILYILIRKYTLKKTISKRDKISSVVIGVLALLLAALILMPVFTTNAYHPTATSTPVSNLCMSATRSNQKATSAPLGFTFCTYRGQKGPVYAVAWSPDGKRIASAGADGTVQVWDATTGSDVTIYRGHKGSVNAVAWSPYGQRIASGGVDGDVQVWDPDTGSLDYSYSSLGKVSTIAWSPDGQWIAYGTEEGDVEVFDALKGETESVSFSLSPPNKYGLVEGLSWSPDSKLIAISYPGYFVPNKPSFRGRIEIWNQDLTKHLITYDISSSFNSLIGPMAWSPDGKFIAFASYPLAGLGGSLEVRNISQGNMSYDTGFNPGITSLSWSCDSKYIALGSDDFNGLVYLWDIKARKRIFIYQAQDYAVFAVAWSPDGTRVASADVDGMVRVWQASDKRLC